MAAAAPLISDPLVRNLGTIGGSLAHADPAGDWGSVMLALQAPGGRSGAGAASARSPIDDLLVDTFTTSLEPNEILTEVRVPQPAGSSGGTYLKLERKVGDFATVAVGRPPRAGERHDRRAGHRPHGRRLEEHPGDGGRGEPGRRRADRGGVRRGRPAGRGGIADPSRDVRGTAEYKRNMVEVFVRRGLATALETARAA